MSAAQRKQDLADKLAKLALLKEKNKIKSPEITTSPQTAKPKQEKDDIDALLVGVGALIGPTKPVSPPEASPDVLRAAHPTTTSTTTTTTTFSSSPSPQFGNNRKKVVLTTSKIVAIDIPPKAPLVSYEKGTQFPDPLITHTNDDDTPKSPALQKPRVSKYSTSTPTHKNKEEEDASSSVNNSVDASVSVAAAEDGEDTKDGEASQPDLPQLDEDTKTKIIESEPFKEFIDKSSRIIDRALYLSEALDIMQDYKSVEEQGKQGLTREATLKATLFDDRWAKHRSVTDLGWSHKHPELVLSSYSANEGGSHDPDGVVLVWNASTFFQKPEFVFNCQSSVMTAQFSKFHSTIIAGGTYSGQIVLWDTRARAMPVQRTPLSAVGHTHPVYSLAIVGSANAHNLVSVSTDGKMCVWSMDNLSTPTETIELQHKSHKPVTATGAAAVAVTTLSFQEGEVNQFYVGSEEGAIFQAYRHGTTSGITERYDGHFGPVTSTDFHPAKGSIDFSHLLLSASTDWTCKLWSSKFGTKPLYSFEDTTDYVYDARWSPTHPAVFSTVDGTGCLDIWNMNEDTEAPIVKVKAAQRALNRAAWSADGHRIIAGDAAGYMYLYDVVDVVGVPDSNEWNRFEEVLGQLGTASKGLSSMQIARDEDGVPLPLDDYPPFTPTIDSSA